MDSDLPGCAPDGQRDDSPTRPARVEDGRRVTEEAPSAASEPTAPDGGSRGGASCDGRIVFPPFRPQPVPEELHSVYEEGPFTTCSVCGDSLADGRLYEVQKVFRGKEVVFEMGICHSCGETVARDFSEESLEAMKGFLLCKFTPMEQSSHCNFCGFPRALIDGYTIVGACRQTSLVFPTFLMCEKCSEGLQSRLSRKTRDIQGDFVRDHFPGIPADLDFSPSLGGIF